MELKVWTEDGISRIVCGVTESTTCREVMIAIAQVTGGVGRYCMTQWQSNTFRKLQPSDKPLVILKNLGESSKEVKLIIKSSSKNSHKRPKVRQKVIECFPMREDAIKNTLHQKAATGNELNDYLLESKKHDKEVLFSNNFMTSNNISQSDKPSINSADNYSLTKFKDEGKRQPVYSTESSKSGEYNSSILQTNRHNFKMNDSIQNNQSSTNSDYETSGNIPIGGGDINKERFPRNEQSQQSYLKKIISLRKIEFENQQRKLLQLEKERRNLCVEVEGEDESIKNSLKELAELQINEQEINEELEELELVSWKEKLEMESAKEQKLDLEFQGVQTQLEKVRHQISSYETKIEQLRRIISNEEKLKSLEEGEINETMQAMESEQVEITKYEQLLSTLSSHFMNIHMDGQQLEQDLAEKTKELSDLELQYNS